jgi:hypothetical protein
MSCFPLQVAAIDPNKAQNDKKRGRNISICIHSLNNKLGFFITALLHAGQTSGEDVFMRLLRGQLKGTTITNSRYVPIFFIFWYHMRSVLGGSKPGLLRMMRRGVSIHSQRAPAPSCRWQFSAASSACVLLLLLLILDETFVV